MSEAVERIHVTRSRANPGGGAPVAGRPFRERKPPWLKVPAPGGPTYRRLRKAIADWEREYTQKYGKAVTVSCDGCEKGLTAKVSFIARSAEYTPPVIYSLDERAKLVYLIEARPDQPEKFRVGQPVTVTLPKEAPK